ncbi:MAG: HAMP domain-containing histidine kinase [Lachnospiraceae bacterium]|nr:HAMP domain-containing histidine kinase [Lachnospiraceae bacterium]
MKKYDGVMAAATLLYLAISVFLFFYFGDSGIRPDLSYKVEVNKIMMGLEKEGRFSKPDLREMENIKSVSFLSAGEESAEEIRIFYQNRNGMSMTVRPLFAGERLAGYVRFDYVEASGSRHILWFTEGVLLLSWVMVSVLLWYIRQKILKPFHVLSEMPYELSKGHLQGELQESKSRFFGKFVWGIGMLRDTLYTSKSRELKLEKEKKLLLLSISHDIKIPLSAIKLYAKALREAVYKTEEAKFHAAVQIENHAKEIEDFVKEIVNTASEDIITLEVEDSEFYLKEFMDKVREYYEPKCKLVMTDFRIGKFENKLLRGDMDRALEVMENLMENAFKYGDGKEIGIDFYEEDYCQVISIFNTGEAVAEEEMPHLFDSFYRGSNVGDKDGNGLGLYINRQIMMKMEGEIFAQRVEGGMRFCLVFRM